MTNPPAEPAPDVGAILEQLRAEVRARRLARGVAEQGDYERDVRRALDEVELHRVVSAHWPLVAHSPMERAVTMVHKVVRRYLRWYINPIVEQQNAYNDAVARALRLLNDAYLDLAEQVAQAQSAGTPENAQRTAHSVRTPRGNAQDATELNAHDTASFGGDQASSIRQAAALEPPVRFPDLELRGNVAALRAQPPVSAHLPLGGAALVDRAAALYKRLVRQYLRWYINPIVEQQNAANDALTAAVQSMARLDEQRRAQVAALRAIAQNRGETTMTRTDTRD